MFHRSVILALAGLLSVACTGSSSSGDSGSASSGSTSSNIGTTTSSSGALSTGGPTGTGGVGPATTIGGATASNATGSGGENTSSATTEGSPTTSGGVTTSDTSSAGGMNGAGGATTAGTDSGTGGGQTEMEWLPSWATSIQRTEQSNLPPSLANNTLRQFVWPTFSGSQIRLQLSNEKATSPVQISKVHIALPGSGAGEIDPSTDAAFTFEGNPSVTIEPGSTVWSDALDWPLEELELTALTIQFGASVPTEITGHPGARTTSYVANGDAVSSQSLSGAQTRDRWYFINAIEVMAPADAAAISVLGDSITDGYGVLNQFARWPDFLTLAIKEDPMLRDKVSVLNAGMGANSLLNGNGDQDSGLVRFERDVLGRPKVKWVIVLHGVNDIGNQSNLGLVDQITGAYQQIIDKAHEAGILAYGSPITPFKGHSYAGGQALTIRSQINDWVKTSGAFDAVVDLADAIADPADKEQLLQMYSNDGLHPNLAGYEAMGNAVDLSLFYNTL